MSYNADAARDGFAVQIGVNVCPALLVEQIHEHLAKYHGKQESDEKV